jgi:SAM domain (Sterile alpha motif)
MQAIAHWLNKLGLSEYAERFAENDVDMAVLPDLSDQRRKDLGGSLAHRSEKLRGRHDLANLWLLLEHPRHPLRPSQPGCPVGAGFGVIEAP